jgi:predicted ester cyclase
MASITAIAKDFFAACETGKGWEACKAYCTPNATFAAQAEPLADIKTLAEYTDWMKGLMTIMPNGSYEAKSFATDSERNNVAAYAVFSGTHAGSGGPVEPTGKKTTSDYVYRMAVRIKPVGSLSPGMINLAITPAKPSRSWAGSTSWSTTQRIRQASNRSMRLATRSGS